MTRHMICLPLLLVVLLVTSAGAATPGTVNTAMLNLRSGPGQNFSIVSTLPMATPLVVLGENGDWRQVVTATGRTGWVFGQFVALDPGFASVLRTVVVRANALNVRQGPGTSYPILASVREGTNLAVTGQLGSWLQVRAASVLGFVHADFVGERVADIVAEKPETEKPEDGIPLARVNVSVLNLRSGAGTEFPIVARLTRDTVLAVLRQGDFAHVMLENGVTGFVASEFVVSINGQALGRISGDMVNQRSGPGMNFPVLTTHPRGQTVAVTGLQGDWVAVRGTVGSGFILNSLLSFSFGEREDLPQSVGGDLSRFTVAIDPGHGGRDPGAIAASGLRESDVNLTMSHRLRARLEAVGVRVVMTRTTDVGLTLAERIDIANNAGADLVVSIHNNSHTNPQISGTQTFYGVTDGSHALALGVHRRLVALGLNDRSVLTANFAVLRRTTIPAILTETAFVSNPNNAALLAQDSFLDQAVDAHFEAIREWLLGARRTRID